MGEGTSPENSFAALKRAEPRSSHDAAASARAEYVTLRGGPCDGFRVQATVCKPWRFSSPLLMEDTLDPGSVARYRPSRKKGVYTFREMDRVVARIPAPGGSDV